LSSRILVDEIEAKTGTGTVTVTAIVPEIDMYRLTANHNTNATLTAWERIDDASFTKVGTGMSVSSGIFTFPKTGVYKVTLFANIQNVGGDTNTTLVGEVSSDSGSNFDETIFLVVSDADSSNYAQSTVSGVGIVNVTDTSTFQFQAVGKSFSGSSTISGNTDKTRCGLLFERVADAQT
tara:strand:- start:28 stop:564 length:537 start_codon:yes stop_codon:yes gene_type:complete